MSSANLSPQPSSETGAAITTNPSNDLVTAAIRRLARTNSIRAESIDVLLGIIERDPDGSGMTAKSELGRRINQVSGLSNARCLVYNETALDVPASLNIINALLNGSPEDRMLDDGRLIYRLSERPSALAELSPIDGTALSASGKDRWQIPWGKLEATVRQAITLGIQQDKIAVPQLRKEAVTLYTNAQGGLNVLFLHYAGLDLEFALAKQQNRLPLTTGMPVSAKSPRNLGGEIVASVTRRN